mgnify:CR=1 FL=1
MTRINCGIPPKELIDSHLIAEHREIKRIPNAVKNGRANLLDIPSTFRLGTGHVKFFYNKLKYLHDRYTSIHEECLVRGFNITNFSESFIGLPLELYNDYKPTDIDRAIIRERIMEKLIAKSAEKVS